MSYTHPEFLVSVDWLKDHLSDPMLRVFDCTTYLIPDPETTYRVKSGRENYEQAHIPGSAYLDLQEDLSDSRSSLRFTLPSEQSFSKAAGQLGISNDNHLVFYSCTHPMWATRLWWMFRTHGHQNVSVLDGGLNAWQVAGYSVSQDPYAYPAETYTARFNPDRFADKDTILRHLSDENVCILNSLGRTQHSGEAAGYGRPGRIAGSDNLPAVDIVNKETGLFLSAEELKDKIDTTRAGTSTKVITYCGGGIAASSTLFALALLGREDQTSLYDASMSEWANNLDLPMETG